MSAAHTPGPWAYVVHDHSMASLGVLPDPGMGDPLVCTFSPCEACADRADPKVWEWGRCQTPNEADARLIAAAPELLNCLIAAEWLIDNQLDGEFPETLTEIRAAIAKALGRTPNEIGEEG